MFSKTVTIINKKGLHARAATLFAKLAMQIDDDVQVSVAHSTRNGKSILELLTLAAIKGTEITITTTGTNNQTYLQQLVTLVEDGFGEDD